MSQILKNIGKLYVDSFTGLSKNIWLLSIVTFINRSGSMVFLFLTIYMTDKLNFSLIEAGYVMSFAGAGSLTGAYLGGILSDKFGYYRVMFWSLFLVGCMFFVLMNITTFIPLCIFMFIANLIGDAFRPANFVAIGAYTTDETRTRSISLIRLAINLGLAAGPAIGGIIAAYYSYKWLFILDGITCIVAAFLFIFLLENIEPKDDEVDPHELVDHLPAKQFFVSPFQDVKYLLFLSCVLLVGTAFMQLIYTLPVFLKQNFLYNEDQIGYLLAMNCLVIVVLEMPIIYFFEKKYNNLVLAAFGAVLVGLSFFVFNPFGQIPGIAIISMLLISIGEIYNFPFANDFALQKTNSKNRGKYMGLYTMTFSAATIIAPTLGFYLAHTFGFTILWNMTALLALISAIGFILIYYSE